MIGRCSVDGEFYETLDEMTWHSLHCTDLRLVCPRHQSHHCACTGKQPRR